MTLASLATATVIVDIAIACTVLEAFVLVSIHRWGSHGLAPREYLVNLLSGLCLMLALRSALGAEWSLIALFLSASGAKNCGIYTLGYLDMLGLFDII